MSYESLLHAQDILTLVFLIVASIGALALLYCFKRFY